MLAGYMARLKRRGAVRRYAIDPAVRNYLALASRMHGLPEAYEAAQVQMRPRVGGAHALLQQLFSGIMHDRDPDALSMFLDAHQDATNQATPENTSQVDLTDNYSALIALLASLHRAVRGGFPQIGERFSDSAVRSPHVRDYAGGLAQQRVAVNTPLEQLLDRLGDRLHGVNDSRGHSVHDLHSRILEGDPLDLVESYDLSHRLLQDSRVMPHLRNLQGIMRDTRQASEGILANVVPYIGRG